MLNRNTLYFDDVYGKGLWSWEITMRPITFMLIDAVLYFIIVLIIEYVKKTPKLLNFILKFSTPHIPIQ